MQTMLRRLFRHSLILTEELLYIALLKITIEYINVRYLMNHERKLFVKEHVGEQCNGFRSRRWY